MRESNGEAIAEPPDTIPAFAPAARSATLAPMPTLEIKPTRKAVAGGFKRCWPLLIKMDEPVDAKAEQLFNP